MSFVELPITPKCQQLFTSIVVLHTFTLVVFVLRFLSRYSMRAPIGWDDILTAVGTISSTTILVLFHFCRNFYLATQNATENSF